MSPPKKVNPLPNPEPDPESREALEDFSLPWCQALIADPTFASTPMVSRQRRNLFKTEDTLMGDTFWTPRTIRATLAFYRPASSTPPGTGGTGRTETKKDVTTPPVPITDPSHRAEVRMLVSLGSGLNGHANTAHGAVVMLLLDEVIGLLAFHQRKRYIMTAELGVTFKKPLATPGVVLCRAWLLKERVGRKIWVEGVLEDGRGGEFAAGRGLAVEVRDWEVDRGGGGEKL